MTHLGVDVSEFQGKPDWPHAKLFDNLEFAIARVTFGSSKNDASYAYNRKAIPAAGLIPGGYHFLTSAYPAAQADLFCASVDPQAIHVLDVEYANLDVPAWVAQYRKHFPHHPLAIYTGRDLWSRAAGTLNGAQFGQLWLAGYRPNAYTLRTLELHDQYLADRAAGIHHAWHDDVQYNSREHHQARRVVGSLEAIGRKWAAASGITGYTFAGWSSWSLCQFSDHCSVTGISGGVDGDASNLTLAQLQDLTGADVAITDQDLDAIAARVVTKLLSTQPGGLPGSTGVDLERAGHAKDYQPTLDALAAQVAALQAAVANLAPSTGTGPSAPDVATAVLNLAAQRLAQ